MGVKSRIRSNLETIMEAPGIKDYRGVAEVENKKEKCGDDSLGRLSGKVHPRCGVEVNFLENESHDTTESSSSFDDDDVLGPESGSAFSDDEVVSDFQEDVTNFQDELFRMRKKRLTDHWRTFIQPLMWRCKWVELRIRQLNRLERRYTRELAKCDQNELQQVENCPPDRRDKVLKRKRRKRIEDTTDIGKYMSEHNLFSYYENKKVPARGISLNEKIHNIECKLDEELAADEELLSLQPKDGDKKLELVFHKMWGLMDHVSKLKIRLEKVMSDNAEDFSHSDPSSTLVPCNARDPAPPIDRDRIAAGSSHNVSQLLSEFNMGDVALPGNAIMSLGEFEDDVLIYNNRMHDGINGFEGFNVQPAKKPQVAGKEYPRTSRPPVFEEETEMLADEPPAQKTRSLGQITASGIRKSQRGRVPRRLS